MFSAAVHYNDMNILRLLPKQVVDYVKGTSLIFWPTSNFLYENNQNIRKIQQCLQFFKSYDVT